MKFYDKEYTIDNSHYMNSNPNVPFYGVIVGFACNRKCIHCGIEGFKMLLENKDWYDIELLKKEIDAFTDFNKELIFTGGEPSIYPKMKEILEYASSKGFKNISMCTNGMEMSDHAKEFKDAGLTRCYVTVMCTPDTAEEIHGRADSYDALVSGVQTLRDNYIEWFACITVIKQNYKRLDEIARIIKSLEPIGVSAIQYFGASKDVCYVSSDDFMPYYQEFKDILRTTIKVYENNLTIKEEAFGCPSC